MASRPPKARTAAKPGHTGFAPLAEFPSVLAARKSKLSMFALQLRDTGVCVVSPLKGAAEKARESLAAMGPVRFIFAPNHYHNLGLEECSQAYPDAKLVAPAPAIPRLQKVTGLSLTAPDALASALPQTMVLLETEGLKTGESWLQIKANGHTAWIVVDAFCGPGVNGEKDEADLLKPFPNFGLGDKDQYLSWLERQLEQDPPDTLIPCHGRAVQSPTLSEQLVRLVRERL